MRRDHARGGPPRWRLGRLLGRAGRVRCLRGWGGAARAGRGLAGRVAVTPLVPVLVLVLVTAACAVDGDPAPGRPASASASVPADPLPRDVLDALRVEVRQSRTDRAARVVQLAVRNEGTTDVEVVAARLTSPTVEGVAESEDGRRAPAGTRRDLSVALGDPVCGPGAPTDAVAATVHLELADDAGRRATLDVTPEDPNGHLVRIHDEDCAAVAVASGAGLALGPGLVTRQEPDGRWVGAVELVLTPRPGGPEVTVDEVDRTVLLDPAAGGAVWPAGLSTAPGAPRTATLDVVPARCDPHAVAEDKRGTAFGLHVRVDGVAQHVVHVTADDDLRGLLHDFVALACGWPTS